MPRIITHVALLLRDYRRMVAVGVRVARELVEQAHGTVAVFADLYGNPWDLLQYTPEGLARLAASQGGRAA